MINLIKRSNSVVANQGNGIVFLANANYAVIGLTDHKFVNSDKKTIESYHVVLAQLDANNNVVNLVKVPFTYFATRRVPYLTTKNELVNNTGNFVAFVDDQIAKHSDDYLEFIWHKHIVPNAEKRVLAIKATMFRTTSAKGTEYTNAVYDVNKVEGQAFNFEANRATIEQLAIANKFAIYRLNEVINQAVATSVEQEKTPAQPEPAQPQPAPATDVPF